MTTRLILLLTAALLCWAAPVQGQTIKTLGYSTTNGNIVAATNVVWTNAFSFSTNTVAAQVRTNVGLGATWLTNTNVTNFRLAIGLEVTNGSSVEFAAKLWDSAAGEQGFLVEDNEILVGAATANTNAPTDTTNATRWINVIAGTNTYKLPLYQ
jgi:hypothetical protein